MQQYVTWFEIPVSDYERAVAFYEHLYQITMERNEIQGVQFAYFPTEDGGSAGAICHGEGYVPGGSGTLLYMNANPDMNAFLLRVEAKGGRVLVPQTLITEEQGYFGCFLDSESNRIAVQSDFKK
jgi:hypothetical protein